MTDYEQALSSYLQQFLTRHRRQRFSEVLEHRTRWITMALTDVYQQHNASAVLRSCDAFGIQDVHILEMENTFETNSEISLGTEKWLTLHRHTGASAVDDCIAALRASGYRIAATALSGDSLPLPQLPIDQPLALLFGTEKDGLPDAAIEHADVTVQLPMYGFVESFNVSVAAALSLQTVVNQLHQSTFPWKLTEEERAQLYLEWTRRSIPGVDAIERRFQKEWSSHKLTNE